MQDKALVTIAGVIFCGSIFTASLFYDFSQPKNWLWILFATGTLGMIWMLWLLRDTPKFKYWLLYTLLLYVGCLAGMLLPYIA